VFLVTVHDPICTESGNLEAALYGSFLPIPADDVFPPSDPSDYTPEKTPGAIIAKKERITINKGRHRIRLRVANNGDRPIQASYRTYVFQSFDSFTDII
jgi:urease